MEKDLPTLLATKAAGLGRRKQAMKKLILFAAALLIAGQASANAQGDQVGRHHKRLMSAHAQMRDHGGGFYHRGPVDAAPVVGPGYYNDDPDAEGRTSG
jgi:hypothetical protein